MKNIIYSSMEIRVKAYIKLKKDLGYALKVTSRELLRFARFADENKHQGPITISLILRWAQSSKKISQLYRARRVETVRTFARYEATFEPRTQIPPRRILGPAHRRIQPYIYSQKEVTILMEAADKLTPINGLRPRTYSTLIGLIASTGLRTSEALHLKRTEFEPENGRLIIRDTKFHKSRIVPIAPSVTLSLKEYLNFLNHYHVSIASECFLLSEQGRELLPSVVHYTFQKLRRHVGLDEQCSERAPRLYDLRHTFACRVLQRWYIEGVDINQRLPYLSTYLGHVKPSDTYWYLSAVPELMEIVQSRFNDSNIDYGCGGEV